MTEINLPRFVWRSPYQIQFENLEWFTSAMIPYQPLKITVPLNNPDIINNVHAVLNFVKASKSKDLVLPPNNGIFFIHDRSADFQAINIKNKENRITNHMRVLDNKRTKKFSAKLSPSHSTNRLQGYYRKVGYSQRGHHNIQLENL
jgi:hypothetical protein